MAETAPETTEKVIVVQTPIQQVKAVHSSISDVSSALSELPQEVIDQIRTYDWDSDIAIKIVEAESNNYARAYNPEAHKGCQSSRGYFQIGCVNYAGDLDDLYVPEINVRVAYQVYKSQGWRAWGVCKNGRVQCW